MTSPVLLTDLREGIARVTLNRPDAMNSLDTELAAALAAFADQHCTDPRLRVVLLQGAGRMFCAGGDLRALSKGPDALRQIVTDVHRAVLAFARMDALLVVAAASAAGAGLSLIAGADYAIVAAGSKFTSAYT